MYAIQGSNYFTIWGSKYIIGFSYNVPVLLVKKANGKRKQITYLCRYSVTTSKHIGIMLGRPLTEYMKTHECIEVSLDKIKDMVEKII